ncbi:MAG: hypothetical protein WCP52_03390 [Bacteroidota bacterium]
MNKKVLVIYYSQSGQLEEILNNIVQPLKDSGNLVEQVRIQPATAYPFPWNGEQFFSVMPDCVLDQTTQLIPFELKEKKYDLILLGYQAWFLSPSIPVNSLLETKTFKDVLKGTPVITVTGARNMWISAFERIKKKLLLNEAKLVGNIAMFDKHPNFVSFITIFQWMFKARKERYLGIFPKPGVSQEDIDNATTFGDLIVPYLTNGNWEELQKELIQKKAIEVKYRLMYIENTASKLFLIWANFIVKQKKRTFWLVLFKYYLLLALFIAAPIILTVDAIFIKPFSKKKIQKRIHYYLGVN